MMGLKTGAEIEARVIASLSDGKSLRAAASECGVSRSVVQRIVRDMGRPDVGADMEAKLRPIVARLVAEMASTPDVILRPTGCHDQNTCPNFPCVPHGYAVTLSPGIQAESVPIARKTFPVEPRTRVVDLGRKYERIAFLSDLHHPFQDDAAIDCALACLEDFRPQLVILGGDYFDCYSISDHDKEPGRADHLQDEFDASRCTHAKIDEACPGDIIFIDGNHEERIQRIQRAKPGLFRLRSLELPAAAELPKRWLYYPNQTRFRSGPLTLLHGDIKGRGTSSMHAAKGMLDKLRTSCLFGHLHRFQAFHQTGDDGSVRGGFANGHLCDVGKAHYITNPDWQQGFSTIEYDWSINLFSVTQHLICDGWHRWNGKTY